MKNHKVAYINKCKHLIEKQLGWPPSAEWKQRDFLNLATLIDNQTGIALSLSTVKRIWKPDYNGLPHPATLEALAKFLGYDSWLAFETKYTSTVIDSQEKNNIKPRYDLPTKYKIIFLIAVPIFGMIILLLLTFNPLQRLTITSNANQQETPVFFSSENAVSIGVPNTVIFNYDIEALKADSFFIQQSWDKFRRDRIDKTDKTLTSVYYFPGFHQAKLIANDKVVKETLVRVTTDGWLALAREGYGDHIPTYIRNPKLIDGGNLHVSASLLEENKVIITNDLVVGYYFVKAFDNLQSGDFNLQIRLKSDSLVNVSCPHIGITILGEKGMHFIPLTSKGCIGNATVKFGNTMINGKNNDLSSLGINVYDWHLVKAIVKNNKATLFIDNSLVFETIFDENVGQVVGINVNFTGSGSIDFVEFAKSDNKIQYREDFE